MTASVFKVRKAVLCSTSAGDGKMSHTPKSVTNWIIHARHGCEQSATLLWHRYQSRLLAIVAARVEAVSIADESDVVNEVFGTFFIRLRKGAYLKVTDRNQLWLLLRRITINKSQTLIRDQLREKRNMNRTVNEHALRRPLATIAFSRESNPESHAVWIERILELLSGLDDSELREITMAKLEGLTNAEIAQRVGRSVPTIERRLRIVRKRLKDKLSPESG